MNEANQGNNPDASAIVSVKRKRGRPRKYPRPDPGRGRDVLAPRVQNPSHGGSSHVPPRFVGVNGNQPRQEDSVNDDSDVMVGQAVHGVIEAAFDAGYLLTVRVDNLETTLRGVVFKPGHYVPVSADNDVAPGVQMIRRNEIPLPRETYTQVYSHNRSRERNGTAHASRAANPVVSKGRQAPSISSQISSRGISRGNVVPVVLQPVELANGTADELSAVATQPMHAVASKGKQVLDAAHPSNGLTPTNQVQAVETQLLHFQSQNKHQVIPTGKQNEAGVNQNSAESLQKTEAQSMKLPGMPFEKLLTEVIKRTQVSSSSTETNTSSAVMSAEDSGLATVDGANDADQPFSVEPLHSVQPVLHNHPAVVARPLENYRTGKMTELLQVLQENMTENQATPVQDAATDPRPEPDELSPETEPTDEENGYSKKQRRLQVSEGINVSLGTGL